jgi:Transposase DDE domain
MNPIEVLYSWSKTIAKSFTFLSKPQAYVLAAFSLGIVQAGRCTLARVAERLFWMGKADTVERRLQRFLGNQKISLQDSCRGLAAWVLSSLVFGTGTLVLLVDETALGEHLKVMAVCLAYRGRAIPLAWWCYHQEQYPMKQIKLIDTLLGWVAPYVPADCKVLVQADRGIGTSPGLLRCIEQRGWHFLMRVQGTVRLRLSDGQIVTFRSRVERPGQQWSGQVEAFRKAGWRPCWAMAYWGKGYEQPWLLLSNWPEVQAKNYGWRMWEELAFRDFKSYGWHWHKSHVWDPDHANRLWLAMALAYVWTLSLGTQAAHLQAVRKQVSRGKKLRRSLFSLGIRVLHQFRELYNKVIRFFELFLIPYEPEKSVVH